MNEKQKRLLERNLTHEQKVRISLWDINMNIKYGNGWVITFILLLMCFLTKSLLFGIISIIGMWAILIALQIVISKDKKFIEEVLDYYERENKIKTNEKWKKH